MNTLDELSLSAITLPFYMNSSRFPGFKGAKERAILMKSGHLRFKVFYKWLESQWLSVSVVGNHQAPIQTVPLDLD
jgi:hypothetical protein